MKTKRKKISEKFKPKIHDRINEWTFFAFISFDTLLKFIYRTQSAMCYPHSHEWSEKKYVIVYYQPRNRLFNQKKNYKFCESHRKKSKKKTAYSLFILIILLKHQIKLLNKISFNHIHTPRPLSHSKYRRRKIHIEIHTIETFEREQKPAPFLIHWTNINFWIALKCTHNLPNESFWLYQLTGDALLWPVCVVLRFVLNSLWNFVHRVFSFLLFIRCFFLLILANMCYHHPNKISTSYLDYCEIFFCSSKEN